MDIIIKPITELLPAKYNPRKDLKPGDAEYEKLRRSIEEFGCVEPIVWNKQTDRVVGGHQRLKVLWRAGIAKTEVVVVDLPEDKEKALNIALNKISGDWDVPKLKDLLADLKAMDFDLSLTGFDVLEIEDILGNGEVEEDEPPPVPENPITKTGDLYLLGGHRVLCGDAIKSENVERLMAGRKADMVFTDPPYGINIVSCKGNVEGGGPLGFNKGKIGGEGIVKPHTYKIIRGDDKPFDPRSLLDLSERVFVFGANNFAHLLPLSSHWLVWDKKPENGKQDGNSFSDCELIWTSLYKRKNVKIYRWLWAGLVREGDRKSELARGRHPTQKPVGLCAAIIKDYSEAGMLILDPYLGSGSTLIAAEQTGRILYGCEIDSGYCDVIVNRWEKFTGRKAILDNG